MKKQPAVLLVVTRERLLTRTVSSPHFYACVYVTSCHFQVFCGCLLKIWALIGLKGVAGECGEATGDAANGDWWETMSLLLEIRAVQLFSRRNRAEISWFWKLYAVGAVYVHVNFGLHLLEAFHRV